MIRLTIHNETDNSLELITGARNQLQSLGEEVKLEFTDKLPLHEKNSILTIIFIAGLLFGVMFGIIIF